MRLLSLGVLIALATITAPTMSTASISRIKNNAQLAEARNIGGAVVFVFKSSFCQPCKTIEPLINNLAETYADRVKLFLIDLTDGIGQAFLAEKGITAVPTLLFVTSGVKLTGALSEHTYKEAFEAEVKAAAKKL